VDTIDVGISGLRPIDTVNAILTGAQAQIRCDGSVVESAHSENHWGQEVLNGYVQKIAEMFLENFHEQTTNKRFPAYQEVVLFDYKNTWKLPHQAHRLGYNADIEWHVGVGSSCRDLTITEKQGLVNIIQNVIGEPPKIEDDHYHLPRVN
jgi:hypothetical protein